MNTQDQMSQPDSRHGNDGSTTFEPRGSGRKTVPVSDRTRKKTLPLIVTSRCPERVQLIAAVETVHELTLQIGLGAVADDEIFPSLHACSNGPELMSGCNCENFSSSRPQAWMTSFLEETQREQTTIKEETPQNIHPQGFLSRPGALASRRTASQSAQKFVPVGCPCPWSPQ